jgi:PAB-dependent poly(A)-specific ribonuclease subunit 2
MLTVPTSKLGVDLLANQNVISKRYKGKKIKDAIPNPNKMLYNQKISSLCYEDGLNGRRKQLSRSRKGDSSGSSGELHHIPPRYKLQVRPGFTTSGAFDPSDYNDTGLLPGWDYDTSMPNAWVSPVLLLFYFIPEVRAAALAMQVQNEKMDTNAYEKALAPELGFVFHQMESLSRYGLLHPPKGRNQPFRPKIGAWVPSNLLTFISTMPEAEQLQVLDGSPAALDQPRRPESFYRFLAYQLDKEISSFGISPSSSQKLMDSLNGLDFFGCNQYIESKSSPPTQSVTRALTLDLNYDIFPPGAEKQPIRFGQLLQHSLCRATRLRAWNSKSHAYETIVQRKIATSLPKILTLSCACAGRKEEDGLWAWRTDHGHEPWLPEIVEVELLPDGNVQVTEFHQAAEGHGETKSVFRGKGSLPEQVSKMISAASSKQKYRYRLEAVLSFVVDNDGGDAESDDSPGHHVLHSRVAIDYKCNLLKKQIAEAWEAAKSREKGEQAEMQARSLVLSANVSTEEFEQRAAKVQSEVENMEKNDYQNDSDADWVLYNGFMVSKTSSEDARAFHVSFKEPVIVMFQAIDGEGSRIRDSTMSSFVQDNQECLLPPSAINPRSLSSVTKGASTGFKSKSEEQRPLAFDAEFVAVQEAETTVAEGGQKIVLRDTRHTLGRISVFDCVAQEVLIDDHVLPREPVVDYLTRFSGIIADDLNPSKARHRIISTRSAYLQLRYLLEKGCIFVGHGLKQDFATVNLAVPPTNILDTVEIFHQPGMRYISLRFLANYVLGRDMQQDVHDSVEDARAACELYQKALEWKQEGVWDERLREMYSYGDKTSWKLGVEESK